MYSEKPQVSAPDPNVPAANAYHAHNMRLPIEEFLMDIHPVTTAEYAAYLRETGYTPVDTYTWLKNWGGQSCGTPTASPPLRLAITSNRRRIAASVFSCVVMVSRYQIAAALSSFIRGMARAESYASCSRTSTPAAAIWALASGIEYSPK